MTRVLFAVLVALALGLEAAAQTPPSEARIRADVVEHIAPTATSVTVRGDGRRELNRGVYEYVRSITVRYPHAEVPGVEIEGHHDIVYQSHGSSYAFSNVRVGDWQYFGMPEVTEAEVLETIGAEIGGVFPTDALDLGWSLTIAGGEEPRWHNLESVTVPMEARYKATHAYQLEAPEGHGAERVALVDVRLYRDDVSGPWERFIATERSREEVGTFEVPDDVRTIREAAEVAALEAEASALPTVDVPAFRSGRELADYTYRMLRESDAATFEAYLLAVLAPDHFVEGSTTALGAGTQMEMVDPILEVAFDDELSFRDVTCATPLFDEEGHRRSSARYYYHSLFTAPPRGDGRGTALEVYVTEAPGAYRNGERLPGRPVIQGLSVYTGDEDDAAWLRSFDDPAMACAAMARAATPEAQGAQEATERAGDSVRGAVEEGRRRIGRIFGRGGN